MCQILILTIEKLEPGEVSTYYSKSKAATWAHGGAKTGGLP